MAKKSQQPNDSDELKPEQKANFNIQLNSLGEIVMNFTPEEINSFLDKKVKDKKLNNPDELKEDND
jgi:hypothetical protein